MTPLGMEATTVSLSKKALLSHLKTMLANTVLGAANPGEHSGIHTFLGSDSTISIGIHGARPITLKMPESTESTPTLSIVDDGWTALEDFIAEANKDEMIGEQVGRKAIEQEVQILVRRWLGRKPDDVLVEGDIRDSLKRLRSLVRTWTVFFSLENLILKDIDSFRLGRVLLVPTVSCRSDVKSRLFNHIDGSASEMAVKLGSKAQLDDTVSEFWPVAGTTAVLTAEAEESRAGDVARRALNEALSVLRGFTHLQYPRKNRCLFDLKGRLIRSREAWIGLTDGRWLMHSNVAGALQPYELTDANVDHLRTSCALGVFDSILSRRKQERTQLEQAIVVALQWHGAAVNASTPAEEFVWHTVAIERLLICDKETSTTDRFADRLAWLLGPSGVERRKIRSLATRLYGIRSDIVHAGETRVEEEHVQHIELLASGALITMAQQTSQRSTQENFRDWVEAQKMGG